jgi:hypothetical protein
VPDAVASVSIPALTPPPTARRALGRRASRDRARVKFTPPPAAGPCGPGTPLPVQSRRTCVQASCTRMRLRVATDRARDTRCASQPSHSLVRAGTPRLPCRQPGPRSAEWMVQPMRTRDRQWLNRGNPGRTRWRAVALRTRIAAPHAEATSKADASAACVVVDKIHPSPPESFGRSVKRSGLSRFVCSGGLGCMRL